MSTEGKGITRPEDSGNSGSDSTRTLGSAAEATGSIGPYRLLRKIGEGGMGEVWLAEQAEPVRRRVALKVIKQGMDTKQVIARFEAERQALAMMDHPYIAKVFEAGSTPEGRPYFAMEHVPGVPITEHCDRLTVACDGDFLAAFYAVEQLAQVGLGLEGAHS